MSPAKVSLADLLAERSLERVSVDTSTCTHLLTQARNHLRTATAGVQTADPEGAFQLAYDACRKTCLALLLSMGLRPRGDASHAVTFEAAATVADNFAGRRLVRDAANLRYVRHGVEYRAETVSLDDAQDAIGLGAELLALLEPKVEQILAAS